MTVEDLKHAIAELALDERRFLAVWRNELDNDDWDKEMAKDFSPGGRGYDVLEKVKRKSERATPARCEKDSRNATNRARESDDQPPRLRDS